VKDAISYATTARQISHLTCELPHLSSPTVLGLRYWGPGPPSHSKCRSKVDGGVLGECGERDITELGSPVGWTVTSDRDPATRFDSLFGAPPSLARGLVPAAWSEPPRFTWLSRLPFLVRQTYMSHTTHTAACRPGVGGESLLCRSTACCFALSCLLGHGNQK
jgi:hypothetical protein